MHAYWKLSEPLPAPCAVAEEPIERANARIIHALGVDPDGRPNVADPQCHERARVMRLAGTINYKSGQYARVVEADLQLPGYRLEELVGDLAGPGTAARGPGRGRSAPHADPYKRIPPPEYFQRLAGITVPRNGLVSCPAPWHDDVHPSCSVGIDPEQGWCCHSARCGARGAIYDLASVLLGGPWGQELRGDAFKRARAHVVSVFGEHGAPMGADAELVIVVVRRVVSAALAGHAGCSYTSPPQPREQALALVALLLGCPTTARGRARAVDATDRGRAANDRHPPRARRARPGELTLDWR